MTIPDEGHIQPVLRHPATSSAVLIPIPSAFIDCFGTNDVCHPASGPSASVPSVGPTTQNSTVTTPELAPILTERPETEGLDQTRPEVKDQPEEVPATSQDLTLPGFLHSESHPQEPRMEAGPLSRAEEPSANLQCQPAATMIPSGLFVCFVALRPKSTALVITGRSVHLTTLFPGQA